MLVTPIIDHATVLGAEGAKFLPSANARNHFNLTTDKLLTTALEEADKSFYVVTHLCKCTWKEPTDLSRVSATERQEIMRS